MRKRINSHPPMMLESLESRQLMSIATPGTNLLVNGDAEADTGASDSTTIVTPTAWQSSTIGGQSPFTAVKYGTAGFPSLAAPGPTDRGNNFFAGGPTTDEVSAFQDIDVSAQSIGIDAGVIKANLAGWLGGFGSEGDNAALGMDFIDKNGRAIGTSVFAGTATVVDRGNVTEFLQRSTSSVVPANTRTIRVFLDCFTTFGSYNDGYADDLSLKLTSTAKTGYVTVSTFVDLNEDGAQSPGEKSLPGVTLFIDKNANDKLDKGELSVKTNKSGNATFANVPQSGGVTVEPIFPAGYRLTSAFNPSVPVIGGATTSGLKFGFTPNAVLNGSVFIDNNGDGILDGKDRDIAGVIVYLDFNNNGQLDPFELSTTSGSGINEGNYKFVVPFGTYVIRIKTPAGYKLTSSASTHVSIGKGQFSTTDIGIKKA